MLIQIRIEETKVLKIQEANKILGALEDLLQDTADTYLAEQLTRTVEHYEALQNDILRDLVEDHEFVGALLEGIDNF